MLNGKFYTGLPPGMIERSNGSRNRMQSSIFWPDDTKTDSATEARVKRRASLQLDQTERPRLRVQTSVTGENDVNTRQMFQKEFSKSSILFRDNLQEDQAATTRKPLLRTINCARSDVTPKPTAMKLPLPENVVNEGYTTAKKKQAFTSKIEFNDYAMDELNNKNITRQRKMDMNDKREMERNTKNSPKLQVKKNMRTLSMDDCMDLEPEREYHNGIDYRDRDYVEKPMRRNAPRILPVRRSERDYNDSLRRYSPIRENRYELRHRIHYEEDMDAPAHHAERYDFAERRNNTARAASVPKRILKNSMHDYEHELEHNTSYNNDYGDDYNDDDIDYVERRVRDMRVRTSPKKHVTYSDETYDDEHISERLRSVPATRARSCAPNLMAGSNQRQPDSNYNCNDVDLDLNDVDDDAEHETDNRSMIKPYNKNSCNNNNNNSRFNANNKRYKNNKLNMDCYADGGERMGHYNNKLQNNNRTTPTTTTRRVTSKTMPTKSINKTIKRNDAVLEEATTNAEAPTRTPAEAEAEAGAENEAVTDVKKHLRSSLCLHNGEIVASDANVNSGAGAATKAPTRNARNSATRQRVSVGLPD